MGRWRTLTETWLAAEQRGPDEAAEAAFHRVFEALPVIEPSPAFLVRTAEAAEAARGHRRRMAALAAAAAAVLAVAATGVVLYAAFGGRVGWLLTMTAAVASGSLLSTLAAAATVIGWWSAAAGAASTLAAALATPYSVAALMAVELLAVAALAVLQRLLRSEVGFRTPRAYCF